MFLTQLPSSDTQICGFIAHQGQEPGSWPLSFYSAFRFQNNTSFSQVTFPSRIQHSLCNKWSVCVCVYICVDILMQQFGSLFTRLQTPPWQVQAFPVCPYSVCYCSQGINPWWMAGLLNSEIPILRKEMWWPSEDMLPRGSGGHKTRDILFPQAIRLQSFVGSPRSLVYTLGRLPGNVHALSLAKPKDAPHAEIQKMHLWVDAKNPWKCVGSSGMGETGDMVDHWIQKTLTTQLAFSEGQHLQLHILSLSD